MRRTGHGDVTAVFAHVILFDACRLCDAGTVANGQPNLASVDSSKA